MNNEEIYLLLKEKIPGAFDYVDIICQDVNEPLVPIIDTPYLQGMSIDKEMARLTNHKIYLRESVLNKLDLASTFLRDYDKEMSLLVVYGYRTPDIQEQLFQEHLLVLQEKYSDYVELIKATHMEIAYPKVAGHPTGGAIDLQIMKDGQPLDFGTRIWEFVDDSLVFSPFIHKDAWRNRQFLRRIMIHAGFAPFDGEWWHFSYGDKEWANYYERESCLYSPIAFAEARDKFI